MERKPTECEFVDDGALLAWLKQGFEKGSSGQAATIIMPE